jgi:DNA-binding NarL/FixJ family response regulator
MKLLIVDDHPVYLDGLAALVGQLFPGAQVEQAGTADLALHLLAHAPADAPFDLLLLDLGLPGLRGEAALPLLRTQFPALPVIVVSATDDAQLARTCIAQGASGFMHKSLRRQALAAALQAVLDGGVVNLSTQRLASLAAASQAENGAELTPRQHDVLHCLGRGYSNKLIARHLDIAEATVRAHLSAVFHALGASSRTQAVLEARRRGWLTD